MAVNTIWLLGLPCSGKTTIAKKLKTELQNSGYSVAHLDGDDVRDKINKDLGFSKEDRIENLRRVAHICKLFNDNGHTVISSFVTPTKEMRDKIREIIPDVKMIYLNSSLKTCENRDVKGMYKKARQGKIKNFTGIDDPFEPPKNTHIIDTENQDIDESIKQIMLILNKEST